MSGLGRRARLTRAWAVFWLRRSGPRGRGRLAARLAAWGTPPYKGRCYLAELAPQGYFSPRAALNHSAVTLGRHVFIGDGVIFHQVGKGRIEIGDGVHLYADVILETGPGGEIVIGSGTHIQPGCKLSAYGAAIRIGRDVGIAPNCGFYPYNHGVAAGKAIRDQAMESRGDIVVGDGTSLGFGVALMSGARVGAGSLVGAGAVVTGAIPEDSIAAGVPARVLRSRGAGSVGSPTGNGAKA